MSSTSATSDATHVRHLVVVRVAVGAKLSLGHCLCGTVARSRLHSAGAMDSMAEACGRLAATMLEPLRAAANLKATGPGASTKPKGT